MALWTPLRQRVQSELLKRGHCVACAMPLKDADRKPFPGKENWELVKCKCRRIFVYDKQVNNYRRAKLDEVQGPR